ncbi:MAG: ABC transporter substrate-binding protein [Gemmatimonadales bacterium]
MTGVGRLNLTLACGDYDRTLPLKTGTVRPDGVELNVLSLEPEEMFYRMARLRDFDVAEFSLSTYTVLRGRGEPLIAIPVFPSFAFRHSAIFVREDAGIREPRDLVGKRVGVPKYHMTAAVWVRGILEDEYGVSPSDLHWFEGGEGAAVKEVDVTLPPGLRHELVPGDRTLGHLLATGELDAFIGARRPAGAGGAAPVRRLFPDFRRVERAYYERTGIFPIMHTVVLKEELVREHAWLPRALYEAFAEAKRLAYRRLADTAALPYVLPWLVAEVEETRALMGDDPFPYGVSRNRRTVETLAGYSFRQGLAPCRLAVEELFCESLLDT